MITLYDNINLAIRNKLEGTPWKLFEDEHLVLVTDCNVYVVALNRLGETYQDENLVNIERFLRESYETQVSHCSAFKVDTIYYGCQEEWNVLENNIREFYNS